MDDPERKLIREGMMHKFPASTKGGAQARMFFLFTDTFVYTKADEKGFTFKGSIPLSNAQLANVPDSISPRPHCFTLSDLNSGKNYLISANSQSDKIEWLSLLLNQIEILKHHHIIFDFVEIINSRVQDIFDLSNLVKGFFF